MRSAALGLLALVGLSVSCAEAETLADACEASLHPGLLSPKGYSRVNWTETSEPSSFGRYVVWMQESINSVDAGEREALGATLKASSAAIQRGERAPRQYTGHLTYDAPNRAGVLIRDTIICNFVSDGVSKPSPRTVRLDWSKSIQAGQFR